MKTYSAHKIKQPILCKQSLHSTTNSPQESVRSYITVVTLLLEGLTFAEDCGVLTKMTIHSFSYLHSSSSRTERNESGRWATCPFAHSRRSQIKPNNRVCFTDYHEPTFLCGTPRLQECSLYFLPFAMLLFFSINDYRLCFRGINLVEYDTTAYQYQESGRSYQGKIFYLIFCTHQHISPEQGIALLNMDI